MASIFEKSRLTVPSTYWSFYPVLSFFVIVSLVASQKVEMSAASLSMASFFFIGGWIVPKEIEKFVDIRLLMLMGASLSFAKAMTTTGLAAKIAEAIAGGVSDPTASLFLIYLATLLITELISNNAAAAMMYPIAVKLADTLGVSYKPYVMVVMQAASMAFMCPIGYPTHVMVWLPGQYNFFDFCKFGLFPNFMWMILSVLISKAAWPF
jgi:di/tricarboxylate transporter